jgi:hypothetical protein
MLPAAAPGTAVRMIGASGTTAVLPITVADAVPLPTAVTARICTLYDVLSASDVPAPLICVITIGEAVEPVVRAFHVTPSSVEYS